ncbi:iron reductase [Aquicoccus porphyridii]|uniref:Iron reductase n=1 Tax=Aquicoccus porphyridii TaxID=1852029 RepID=A0A5A9ZG76_9RHOB|nr:ferredoxin reductase family protein [Aquicoccus porphyridii]KAA0916036.1 iron reductase [Aquicoccus porphyridii]RAI52677.1 iron reductase [Rhodobacteraceae bacterium AsT-22]
MTSRADMAPAAAPWPALSARAMALVYLVACVLPIGIGGLSRAAPLDPWEAFGAGPGLAGLTAMAVQVLTSGRFRAVSGGMGIDRVMAFHKIAAYVVVLMLVLHPIAYVWPTWLDDPARGVERMTAYLTGADWRSGVIALGALVLLVAMGVARDFFRYEIWRGSHVILALVALGGGLHHAVSAGRLSALGALHGFWWGVGAVVVLAFAVLYGWRWMRLHRQPWELRRVEKKADRVWELDIQPAKGSTALAYRAGQFVWMTVAGRRFPLFDHPFSIADSPRRAGLSLIIKEAGDFTSTVGELQPGTAIGIDGPHGTFTLERHPGDHVLLIAGGVGIAPIMGLLRDLVARGDRRPVRVAYAVGQPENFACLDEIEAAKEVLDLDVLLISESGEGWDGATGYLDRDKLGVLLDGLDPKRGVVLMCGPGPMVTAVSDTLEDMGMPGERVIYERFDYAGGLAARQDRRRTLGFVAVFAALAGLVALLSQWLI